MPGKNFHIDCSLSHDLRNAFGGIVELQIDRLSLGIVDLYFRSSFPPLTRLAPHQLIKFVDSCTNTDFQGQHFLLFRSLFKEYPALSNDQNVFHY